MVDPNFTRLLALEKRLFGEVQHSIFGECLGFFLHETPLAWDYDCTPTNSITFASTGGDGVHFGFLQVEEPGIYPVVMTVPMGFQKDSRDNNVILGENLREFLALGFHGNHFELEQLVYDFAGTVRSLSQSDQPPRFDDFALIQIFNPEEVTKIKAVLGENWIEASLMTPIIEEFSLKPWGNIERRLEELRQRYLPKLQIDDHEVWKARQTTTRK